MAKKKKRSKRDESITFAWLATFLTLIGFVIAIIAKRNDSYVMYYAKQGLVLFVGFAVGGVLRILPFIGEIFMIFMVVLWFIAWINALSGKRRRTWIVQDLADRINL